MIKDIKEMDALVSLYSLYISYNKISEIKGIDRLVSLHILYFKNSKNFSRSISTKVFSSNKDKRQKLSSSYLIVDS